MQVKNSLLAKEFLEPRAKGTNTYFITIYEAKNSRCIMDHHQLIESI